MVDKSTIAPLFQTCGNRSPLLWGACTIHIKDADDAPRSEGTGINVNVLIV